MEVSSIMTKNVKTVNPSDQSKKAVDLMNRHHIGCVAVVEKDKLVGIITERDILKRLVIPCHLAEKILCKDIMTSKPVTIRPDQDVAAAVDLMVKKKLKKLFVVDGQKLVGIITATDILMSGRQVQDILIERISNLFDFGETGQEAPEEDEDYGYN